MAKDHVIQIRLDKEQHDKIQSEANGCNMTVSAYSRNKLISSQQSQFDLTDKQRMMKILSEMCNGVNFVCDVIGDEYSQICEMLEKGVGEICHILKL